MSVIIGLREGNIRYKIVYLRTNYKGYRTKVGDDLDSEILSYFQRKNSAPVALEHTAVFDSNSDFSVYLNTFSPQNIPLIISPKISSLTIYELDNLLNSNITFPIQNRLVTLFCRSNINENHPNWIHLPIDIRIALDSKIYIDLAQTIFPYI